MLEAATEQLGVISGQRPNVRRARKSIASFKVRAGMPVGVAVTLRGARMWEFVDRLVSIAIPRIRDFRGLNPRSFDGRGNYSLGVREQLIFPEIDYDSIDEVRGLDVTITTSASSDEEAFEMLLALGFPFSAEGRPGEVDHEAEEEERRREEARKRAEAEAAALEQLKEENPEAYAKRVAARGGGRRGRGRRTDPVRGGTVRGIRGFSRGFRGIQIDGQDFTESATAAQTEVQEPGATAAADAAGGRAPTIASSASADCACGSSRTRATSPG